MPFNNRRSWRLKFIDIDSSFSITETVNPINGYIVCRAPKGTQRATYFSTGNNQAIDALMGVGSAHWPDLLEAKSYNQEYPIYISAPPGTDSAYPSQLGGFYVTKSGIHKFYDISEIQQVEENSGSAFLVKVQPGRETVFNGDFAGKETKITITDPNISDFIPGPGEIGFGIFELKNDPTVSNLTLLKDRKLNVVAIDNDPMRKGLVAPTETIRSYWGDNDPDTSEWRFGTGTSAQMAVLEDFGIKYDSSTIVNRSPLKDWIGETNYEALGGDGAIDSNNLLKLLVNGWVEIGDEIYSIPFGIQDNIVLAVSVKEETYCYFAQKSCTEIPTTIKISDIGYDKYRYDRIFAYAPIDSINDGIITMKIPTGLSTEAVDRIQANMETYEFVAFYNESKPELITHIGQYNPPEFPGDPAFYVDVTGNYVTQYFTCQESIISELNTDVFHKIFYIESASVIKHVLTEEECIALYGDQYGPESYVAGFSTGTSAPKNPLFNQITLSCSEQVYAGMTTSGGEFTGSLDEQGKNTYGTIVYWPEILQDDDVSFIVCRVNKKFGDDPDDLDVNGFWLHKRIVDPFDLDRDGSTPIERMFTIEGDRYCSLLVTMNILNQRVGGAWSMETEGGFTQIIKAGLDEALLPEYDDVFIFMEPTGQNIFKADLLAINKNQELAAVISPVLLQPNGRGVFTDALAQKVVVSGRASLTTNAQYAGEFEFYDPITKKKYWCQPIGDVACNLARIIERKYGGWAPAWYNISGDLGGQLKRSVLRSRYQFEDEATHTLDTKGINPIAFTSDDGLMILSQRTTQDPNNPSDWSYIGHSLSFQLVKREIRDNVMRPQILKPINDYWMALRQTQVDGILAKRITGASPIWNMAVCDIAGVNTPYSKAQRNFMIKVTVRVNVFSEVVTLVLENVAQTM